MVGTGSSRFLITVTLCLGVFAGVSTSIAYRRIRREPPPPGLTLEPSRIVFDAVPLGGEATKTFSVTNSSNHPLHILRIHATCGCTRVSFPSRELQPQEKCVVTVSVSGTQRPTETETAWLQVQTDEANHPRYELPVYVSDLVGARMSPALLDWGVLPAGEDPPPQKMRLIWVGKTGRPTGEIPLCIDHPALILGPPIQVEAGIMEFKVQLKSSQYAGGIFSRIVATDANGEIIQGTIKARITTPIEYEPESLIFDRARTGRVLIHLPREEFSMVMTTSSLVTARIIPTDAEGATTVDVHANEGLDWGNQTAIRCCLLVPLKSHGTLSIPMTIIRSVVKE